MSILAALLAVTPHGVAAPKYGEDGAKAIVGTWMEARKLVVFHADGTWGVKRYEGAREEIDGRRWRVEGKKFTLIYPGDHGMITEVSTIVTLTPKKFVVKDVEDGSTQEYERAH